jgi:hypothetical protein
MTVPVTTGDGQNARGGSPYFGTPSHPRYSVDPGCNRIIEPVKVGKPRPGQCTKPSINISGHSTGGLDAQVLSSLVYSVIDEWTRAQSGVKNSSYRPFIGRRTPTYLEQHSKNHLRPHDAFNRRAFTVPNPNCTSQRRRFFQVWLPRKLPRRTDHPVYFGSACFISLSLSSLKSCLDDICDHPQGRQDSHQGQTFFSGTHG